jgi:hypothetical protein
VPAAPAAFTIREAAPAEVHGATAAAWPSAVIADAEAERLLALAVSGATPDSGPAATAAVRLAGALTAMESAALAGAPAPLDGALLRRLAALRLRLALALETAPAPGAPYDLAAVQSLLAEVDGSLQELKAAAEAAAPEVQAVAEQIRNAVVGAAIDLTDLVQRIVPAEVAPVAPSLRGPAARVLSNRVEEAQDAPRRVGVGWIVALGLVAAAAGAFHGHKLLTRQPPTPPPGVVSAPGGMVSVQERDLTLLVREPGKPIDPRQLESFKTQEEVKGRTVREVAPGVVVSQPEPERKGTKP